MRIIKKSEDPKFLVITPLKVGDKISKETKKSVKRNNYPFDWISYEGDNNIPLNTTLALLKYEESYSCDYVIKVDNDINMDRKLLDLMYEKLSKSDNDIGYAYCPFSYILQDGNKISFNSPFSADKLMRQNYISSNSMIKRKILDDVGGFVCDEKYERLLDWAFWLRCLYYGYKGLYIPEKKFITPLNNNNVSSRGEDDYKIKYMRVLEDFVVNHL